MSKVVPRQSRTRETLQFLLDHPRRCFIYLFPSTCVIVAGLSTPLVLTTSLHRAQTNLVPCFRSACSQVSVTARLSEPQLTSFCSSIDWVCFLVLDTGNPVLDAIPTGPVRLSFQVVRALQAYQSSQRVLDGLFQSFAVRAAGFNIVPLSDLAPAVQVLYALMMYIVRLQSLFAS